MNSFIRRAGTLIVVEAVTSDGSLGSSEFRWTCFGLGSFGVLGGALLESQELSDVDEKHRQEGPSQWLLAVLSAVQRPMPKQRMERRMANAQSL
jgi:hypothetical protein